MKIVMTIFILSFKVVYSQIALSQDLQFVKIPYDSLSQGLALEIIGNESTIKFYIGFQELNRGLIKIYWFDEKISQLIEVNEYSLPYEFRHTNDIQVTDSELVVTCFTGNKYSYIGFLNKNDGTINKILLDTLNDGWHLQFCYLYKDAVYRGITNNNEVEIQKEIFNSEKFEHIAFLNPSPIHNPINYIQSSKIICDSILAILTSNDNRIDLYDIRKFELINSFSLVTNNQAETEGLAVVEKDGLVSFFYSLLDPNRIRKLKVLKSLILNNHSYSSHTANEYTISNFILY